jgi:hypothetical protein
MCPHDRVETTENHIKKKYNPMNYLRNHANYSRKSRKHQVVKNKFPPQPNKRPDGQKGRL